MQYLRAIYKNPTSISPITEIKLSFILNRVKAADIYEYPAIVKFYLGYHNDVMYFRGYYPYKEIKIKNDYHEYYVKRIGNIFQLHRDYRNEPACITYHRNGKVLTEEYYVNGKHHRPISHGPAYINYYVNGKPCYVSYWENDRLCRPYTLSYDIEGNII